MLISVKISLTLVPKCLSYVWHFFFFQAEDGIRDYKVTGVQTCALPIFEPSAAPGFVLKAGERPFMLIRGVALIEPRATPGHWKGASQGVSFRIAKGVR